MRTVNDFLEWVIQSGALTAIVLFAWKFVKPLLDAKASHASAEQSKSMWALIDQVASAAVNSLVSNNELTGEQKFSQAVKAVIDALDRQGYTITEDTAKLAVQAAYEKSPLTGNDQSTSTVTVGPEGVTTTIKPADGTATAIDPKEAK